jgi:hypothetical protein
MQTDITFLLQEVQELRKLIVTKEGGGNGNGNGASASASASDKQNMNANQGAKSAPWDATLGMQSGDSSIKDRQIVDAVLSN